MLKFLAGYSAVYGPLRIFDSITFRVVAGVSLGFLLAVLAGKPFIRWMARLRATENVSKPDSQTLDRLHSGKKGTPTMGGAIIIFSMAVSILLVCDPTEPLVLLGLFVLLSFGALGFVDDYMKLKGIGKRGMNKRQKLSGQILLAAAAACGISFCSNCGYFSTYEVKPVAGADTRLVQEIKGGETKLLVPFTKYDEFYPNMGWLYFFFFAFVIVACANAVNLTDGLDGLASGCTIMAAVPLAVLAYAVGNTVMCAWFRIPWVPGAGELAIACAVMVGAVMGFLWFNAHPAQIFMGDTGSLALGALAAYVALVIKHELVLVVAGGIFVIEALSVLIQMVAFRCTGRRVFKCAPFHHHLEFCGWHENKVVVRLWMVGAVLAAVSLASLKLH